MKHSMIHRTIQQLGAAVMVMAVVLVLCCIVPAEEAQAITTTVRVGFCDKMPPFQYTDSQGNPKGFHVDVLEYIAKKEELLLEYQAYNTTFEAMDELEAGNLDIVLGVADGKFTGYSIRYSNPISSTNLCLTTSAALAAKYQRESTGYFALAAELYLTDFTFLGTLTRGGILIEQNQMSTIDELVNGQAEVIVGVKDCLLWYFQEHEIEDDYVILNNYLESADFAMAVREGDGHLYEAINSQLSSLRASGEYETMYNSWLYEGKTIDYEKLLKNVMYLFGAAAVFMAAYLIVGYRAKKKLTQLVEVRTTELYEANQKLEHRTAQAEAENNLRHSIIDASPAGMVLVDENMNMEYMNSSALQIAGISTFCIGDSISRFRIFREILKDVGNTIFQADWDFKSGTLKFYKDNVWRVWEKYRYSIHKVTLYEGAQGALITLENVTAEEKEREAAFEKEKNETLNSLIAGIAHEIKNPLTAISASAAMIQAKGDNEKFRTAFSAYIPQEIERITRLINNLIDYARPGERKTELIALDEILPTVIELTKVTARNTTIHVAMDPAEGLQLRGDRDKLKQVLLNILINSIEATRQKKTEDGKKHQIDVKACRTDNKIIIKVTDDGIGMSADELKRCMNPFYTTKPAGTGIGLALTRQYVEEVGGTITITSEKDFYTCVEIQLPAAGGKEEPK